MVYLFGYKNKSWKAKKGTKQVNNVEIEGNIEIMFHYLLTLYMQMQRGHVTFKPWLICALPGE
jgi:hypothetical protein